MTHQDNYLWYPDEQVITDPVSNFVYLFSPSFRHLHVFHGSFSVPVGLFPITGDAAERTFANVKKAVAQALTYVI